MIHTDGRPTIANRVTRDRAAYREEQEARASLEQAQAATMAAARPQCPVCLQRGHGCTGSVCANADESALD